MSMGLTAGNVSLCLQSLCSNNNYSANAQWNMNYHASGSDMVTQKTFCWFL